MTTSQNEIYDYKRIETAIRYTEQNAMKQPYWMPLLHMFT